MILIKRCLTDSHEQLSKDFKEYPLRCFTKKQDRLTEFFIVQTSPLNCKIYDWIQLYRGVKNDDIDELSKFKAVLQEEKIKLSEQFKTFTATARKLTNPGRFFFYLVLLAFAVIITPIIIIFIIYRFAPLVLRRTHSKNTLGHFLPITYNGKLEIVVKSTLKRTKLQQSDDAIISHEHIHLLQNQYFPSEKIPSRNNTVFYGEKKDSLKNILENPEEYFEIAAYYFSLNEMEARLHEVVLSFYRKNNSLPKSCDEYIQMLSSTTSLLGVLVRDTLKDYIKLSTFIIKPYTVRHCQVQKDIVVAILILKDKGIKKRFILEVLPIMYANLLVLYGYVDESHSFLQTVECKDLFDELYGVQESSLNCAVEA